MGRTRVRTEKLERALEGWPSLVAEIMDMSEAELERLLDMERGRDNPRSMHVKRIHQRLTKLRAARERRALLREIKK